MYKTRLKNLIAKRHLIPDEFWNRDCIWFFDASSGGYDWSASRLGFNKDGKIIWAFDSGCSCNGPWEEFDPSTCESVSPKSFVLNDFLTTSNDRHYDEGDKNTEEEIVRNILDYELLVRDNVKPKEVLSATNAEVRRYLIKRIGYENIKDAVDATVVHKDGDNELLKFATGETYVKVKDSSTDREYLLYVEGNHTTCRSAIAWTFGMREEEYQPAIET